MNLQRNFVIALLFVSFIVWQTWKQDKDLQKLQKPLIHQEIATLGKGTPRVIENMSANVGKKITVKTDVLELTINTLGGDIEQAFLLSYPKNLKSNEPVQLLKITPEFVYQAQSGLIGINNRETTKNIFRPLYSVKKNTFSLSTSQNQLVVPFIYKNNNGIIFTKTFTLRRNEYAVKVDFSIQNTSMKSLNLSIFGQLKQSVNLTSRYAIKDSNLSLYSFRGAAYSTLDNKYKKYKFDKIINNKNLSIYSKVGWIAMLQQYFATAWVPSQNSGNNHFYTENLGNGVVAIGYKSQSIVVQPGQVKQLKSTLWIGPKIQDKMAIIAPNLDLIVDYGWLWFISQPLFKLLKFIYSFLGNWGFSIIVITFIIRGTMYPLTKTQYASVAKMQMLQPKIQIIHQRLGNDKHRISQEMLALYKQERVNPLGGCLPLIIQMPIFLALYYMLIGSVELRHAPFVFWIYDLSSKDPYYVLPMIMGITMFFIQKVSPTTTKDIVQEKILTIMPIIFTVFFLWFPSGLVLYYIVNNLVTIFQQKMIYHDLKKKGLYQRTF